MSDDNKEQSIDEILTAAHREFRKSLTKRSFFKMSNQHTVEDLVQDTFVKAWIYMQKGGKIDVMKSFLYHVLNNLIVDEYRKHKTNSLDMLIEKGFEVRDNFNSHERICNVLDGRAAIGLLDKLPEKYRRIMKMRYAENLSLEEISSTIGQSKNTVAVQLHRGLEKLKTIYHRKEDTYI